MGHWGSGRDDGVVRVILAVVLVMVVVVVTSDIGSDGKVDSSNVGEGGR